MSGRHRTIDRVAAILEFAAADADAGISLAGVTQKLDAPKSSIHGLISGLLNIGYLIERDGRYFVGPGLGVLLGVSAQQTLADAAYHELRRLREETEETVLLGVRVGNSVVYTEQLESLHPIRYAAPMQVRRPMLTTSMGKLFLSEMDERQIRRIVRAQQTDDALVVEDLLDELALVRERRYALNHVPTQAGITALAAGIRDGDGRLTAAIAVRGPSFRMESGKVEGYARLLVGAADRVTAAVGPRR